MQSLLAFIGPDKVGGWVRAWVGAALVALIGKNPSLATYFDPATQTAIAVGISGLAVSIWSHVVKTVLPAA